MQQEARASSNIGYTACLVGRADASAEEDSADNEAGDGGGEGLKERARDEAEGRQSHCGLAAVVVAHDARAQGREGARQEHRTLPQLHIQKAHRAASEEKWADTDLKIRVVGITTSTQSCIREQPAHTQSRMRVVGITTSAQSCFGGGAGAHTRENKADRHHKEQTSRLGHLLPAAGCCQICSMCCRRPPERRPFAR